MRADPFTLTSIFGRDVRYVVPMFQRPYVWNIKEHWEPLWEDIRGVTERVQAATEPSLGPQSLSSVPPHFLGAIVLEQVPTPTGSIDTRSVIDGQQRLATLQVFIGATRIIADKYELDMQARLLGKLLWNDRDLVAEPDQEFKVWPTNSDRDCFRSVMRNESPSPFDPTMSMKLATAMHYFKTVLDSWATLSDEDERERHFGSLVTTLRDHLKVVAIDLDSDDNAQVIFETLNTRGTPLQAADLIKNLLFQRAEQEGDSVETLYERDWAPFDRGSWRTEIRQGRLMRPVLDVFLGHWLAMTKESETLIHQLFSAFRENLISSGRRAAELMADLSRSAEVYRRMERYPLHNVPDHTTISRRKAKLGKVPFYQDKQKTPLHILIDSSGLAVHAGQLRRAPKSRDYRKLHLCVDEQTGEVIAGELTSKRARDSSRVASLVGQIDSPISSARADTAYDAGGVYEAIENHSAHRSPRVLIPPRKGALLASGPASSRQRNRNIAAQARLGKRKWHTESGYSKRSKVETTFHRYKAIVGSAMRARGLAAQRVEARIGCKILNTMTALGMPDSEMIG